MPIITLELAQNGEALALQVHADSLARSAPAAPTFDERILGALRESERAIPIAELRSLCRVRKATLYARLTELVSVGRLVRSADGYRLAGTV